MVIVALLTLSSGAARLAHHHLAHRTAASHACELMADAVQTAPPALPQPAPSDHDPAHRCHLCQLLTGHASAVLSDAPGVPALLAAADHLAPADTTPYLARVFTPSSPRAPPTLHL